MRKILNSRFIKYGNKLFSFLFGVVLNFLDYTLCSPIGHSSKACLEVFGLVQFGKKGTRNLYIWAVAARDFFR